MTRWGKPGPTIFHTRVTRYNKPQATDHAAVFVHYVLHYQTRVGGKEYSRRCVSVIRRTLLHCGQKCPLKCFHVRKLNLPCMFAGLVLVAASNLQTDGAGILVAFERKAGGPWRLPPEPTLST